jgi:hypothetical protein
MKLSNDPEVNPFLWRQRKGPSIFARDPNFTPKNSTGQSRGEIASEAVVVQRHQGKNVGYLYGISEKTPPLLTVTERPLNTYSRAKRQ